MDDIAAALRAAGAPLRLSILTEVGRHGPISPSEIVQRGDTGASLREAAYHFRALRDAGLLVLDEVRTTGGTAQHLYVLSPVGEAIVRMLPQLTRAAGGTRFSRETSRA
jgi:DNA-binding transcriptional ArsR family regulator